LRRCAATGHPDLREALGRALVTTTSKRLAARATARQRQAKANEDQRHREQTELDRATDFEVARMRRDNAAATVIAHEIEMGRQVDILLGLGNSVQRVAELIGEPEPEIKRLRKLADGDSSQDVHDKVGHRHTALPRQDRKREMPVSAPEKPADRGAEVGSTTDTQSATLPNSDGQSAG
jgi:hypothetical protein